MPDVSVPLRVPPLLSIRSVVSSMQGAARFSNVLPSDSIHCLRGRGVRNHSLRLHETRPRLAFDRMALQFASGFHSSRIYSSGLSSEVGTSRARQHLVEVDVSQFCAPNLIRVMRRVPLQRIGTPQPRGGPARSQRLSPARHEYGRPLRPLLAPTS